MDTRFPSVRRTVADDGGAIGEAHASAFEEGFAHMLEADFIRCAAEGRRRGGVAAVNRVIASANRVLVFVIHTKNYTGRITRAKGTLWHGRYPMTKIIDTARWEADQATRALASLLGPLGVTVVPIICVLGAEVPGGRVTLDGVRVVSGGRRVIRIVTRRGLVLTDTSLAQLSSFADTVFSAR